MEKRRAPGWDELRAEMVNVAGDVGDLVPDCPHTEEERRGLGLGEEQQGFRKVRRTVDLTFSLMQLVEMRLQRQGNMALAFVDLEKYVEKNGNGYCEIDGSTRSRSKND